MILFERFHRCRSLAYPADWDAKPFWDADVALLLVALSPDWIHDLAANTDARGFHGVRPLCRLHDPLITMLVQRTVGEFESDLPPDLLYADALTHALGAHVIKLSSGDRRLAPVHRSVDRQALPAAPAERPVLRSPTRVSV